MHRLSFLRRLYQPRFTSCISRSLSSTANYATNHAAGRIPNGALYALATAGTGIALISATAAVAEADSFLRRRGNNNVMEKSTYEPQPQQKVDKPLQIMPRYAVADAVEKVIPSVVNIRRVVTRTRQGPRLFGSGDPEPIDVSCGSGLIISPDGQILTNAHVVQDVSDGFYREQKGNDVSIAVTLSTGETYAATLIASDVVSDIAVIQIEARRQLPVAEFGDSDKVRAGEFVVAVGSPLSLSNSCSFGIISCIRRDLEMTIGEESAGLTYLQTDLAINAGSSGGPLISLDGQVLGVCSKKIAGGVEGIGFAIPIEYAQKVVSELRQHGVVRRPFLGLALISLTPDVLSELKRDSNYRVPRWLEKELRQTNSSTAVGLMVHDVTKGGPGDKAGLKPGDVVVSVDKLPTRTTSEFLAAMSFKVQTNVEVAVRRAATGRIDTATVQPEALKEAVKMR